MEGKKSLFVVCFETGRYFLGVLNEAKEVLEEAIELVFEVHVDPKDPEPDPDKKAKMVAFKVRPAIHSILTIGREGLIKPEISCKTALNVVSLDILATGIAVHIQAKYDEFWENVAAKLLPPKEQGVVEIPKKRLIL